MSARRDCDAPLGYYGSGIKCGNPRPCAYHDQPEPEWVGAVVVARMVHDTHRATTDRLWVRMANHDHAPWVSTDDLGNVICMDWKLSISEAAA